MAPGGKRDGAGAPSGNRNAAAHANAKEHEGTAKQYEIYKKLQRGVGEKSAREIVEENVPKSSKNPIQDYAIHAALQRMQGQINYRGKDPCKDNCKAQKEKFGDKYFGVREAAAYADVSKSTISKEAKKKGMIYVRGSDFLSGWRSISDFP